MRPDRAVPFHLYIPKSGEPTISFPRRIRGNAETHPITIPRMAALFRLGGLDSRKVIRSVIGCPVPFILSGRLSDRGGDELHVSFDERHLWLAEDEG